MTTLYSNAHPDQYNLHDFVAQNLQRELYANVLKELKKNDTEAVVEFSSLAYKFEQSHIDDVQKALKLYYTAFNSRNCATIRSCWLQDPSTELILPGFAKAVSAFILSVSFIEGLYSEPCLALRTHIRREEDTRLTSSTSTFSSRSGPAWAT